jgi:hypothetical protein
MRGVCMYHSFLSRVNTSKIGRGPDIPRFFIAYISSIFWFIASQGAMAQIAYLSGWPVTVQAPTGGPVYIADINDDGENELVTTLIGVNGQNALLYAFNNIGTVIPGFPISGGHFWDGDPALSDFDDDGQLEIVVAQNGNLFLRDQQGSAIWTIPYSGPVFQSKYYPFKISVDDIDKDGKKEIVVTCYSGGAVFVFDAQGNVRQGWPVLLTRPTGYTPPPMYESASIGDIDNDGIKEIVLGVDDGTTTSPARVYCFKPDGTLCPGFPVGTTRQSYRSKAVLVDIEDDGYLDIAIGKETTRLYVYRYDGTLFPGYPLIQSARGIAVGDIYRDGKLEMITEADTIRGNDLMTGANLPNFPFSDPAGTYYFSWQGAPNICELSDDPGLEIAAGGATSAIPGNGKLFAFNLNGQVLPSIPSAVLTHRALMSSCAVNDVDGNGTTDICCGSENDEASVPRYSTFYCWDTGYPYNLDNVDWAMDGFDIAHTGRWRRLYHINKASSQLSVVGCQQNPCTLPPDGNLHAVSVTATRQADGTHPAGQDVRYSRTPGCGEYEGPVIDNGNGTYTRYLRAPLAVCTTEVHAWVNEFKLDSCQTIQFSESSGGAPPPIPDGHWIAGTPMGAAKITSDGTTSRMTWDVAACPAPDYNLYSGPLSGVSSYAYDAWQCSLGVSGSADITLASSNVFFLIVPVNGSTEGSHGFTRAGIERPASGVGHCGITVKDISGTCQQ